MKSRVAIVLACGIGLSACSLSVGGSSSVPSNGGGSFVDGYRVLYNFGGVNGTLPYAGLVDVNGALWGTTSSGGSGSACSGGCGTVFMAGTTGSQRVIYDFGTYAHDGTQPVASLLDDDGTFYGTTSAGGTGYSCDMNCGTVFMLTPAGKQDIVYSFGSYAHDGQNPAGSLIDVGGTLYGTTEMGGAKSGGSVFTIKDGKERIIYSFGSYAHDGLNPVAGLVAIGSTLYGTTAKGGASGHGGVFSVTSDGTEQLIHSFGSAPDGASPHAGLISVKGVLYGTTAAGGSNGKGTVFSVTVTGTETVLHSFGSASDGADPEAPLTSAFGTLYGTTATGGANAFGTIFSVNTQGKEAVAHSFDGTHGGNPYASVIEVGADLFGTTAYGGTSAGCGGVGMSGCGTIFEFQPSAQGGVRRR
jgi:uncharacterized repeat protein (TIGR03803 family)